MSVLKQKRTTSKAEFINTANQIYVETLNFLTRLSARYSRLIAEPVAKLAGEIIDHAEKANSIFPSDNQRIEMRKAHLLEARASLMALDVRLTHVYLILNQNPEGAFTTSKGNPVKSQDAMEKLDKMAQNLGELMQIIIPPSPRRFGGAFVPLITITTTISLLSGRMATTTITMPIILVGCGPDFADIHGQM